MHATAEMLTATESPQDLLTFYETERDLHLRTASQKCEQFLHIWNTKIRPHNATNIYSRHCQWTAEYRH